MSRLPGVGEGTDGGGVNPGGVAKGHVHQILVQGGAELVLEVAASQHGNHAHFHLREERKKGTVAEGGARVVEHLIFCMLSRGSAQYSV